MKFHSTRKLQCGNEEFTTNSNARMWMKNFQFFLRVQKVLDDRLCEFSAFLSGKCHLKFTHKRLDQDYFCTLLCCVMILIIKFWVPGLFIKLGLKSSALNELASSNIENTFFPAVLCPLTLTGCFALMNDFIHFFVHRENRKKTIF